MGIIHEIWHILTEFLISSTDTDLGHVIQREFKILLGLI